MKQSQLLEFENIVKQCQSKEFKTINVASIVSRDAIVDVWEELLRFIDIDVDVVEPDA